MKRFKTLFYNGSLLSKRTLPLVRDKRNIKADEWEKSLNHLLVIFCCPFFFILNSVQRLFKWSVRSSVYFYERSNPRSAKANFHYILNSAIPLQSVNSFQFSFRWKKIYQRLYMRICMRFCEHLERSSLNIDCSFPT